MSFIIIADKLLERFNGPQDKSPFPIGGGYDIVRQNCQHFAACLVMRLCGSGGVNEDVIKLVWGDIKGGQTQACHCTVTVCLLNLYSCSHC